MTLLPGQFARVTLNANTLRDAISVPSEAIVIGPRGRVVYIVDKDDKVESKPVKVLYEYKGTSVISGVESGSRVVVEGKQNLRPGSKVKEAKKATAASAPAKAAAPAPEKK
jgi:multidrug efflux pump subunit AcrA (membrane-fusion protein)